MKQKASRTCWICGKTVDLEACVIDEHGLAVHQVCYTTKTALTEKTRPADSRTGQLRTPKN
jgi:ribosome-binding protein aMBF1 (putative translation factor)